MLSWDEFDTEEETVAKPAAAKAAASAAPDKLDNAAEAAVHDARAVSADDSA
ncbi:MAG TPA: ribonucleotide-diphosphate reductase subunit beta, partial [Pseudomonas sp.]